MRYVERYGVYQIHSLRDILRGTCSIEPRIVYVGYRLGASGTQLAVGLSFLSELYDKISLTFNSCVGWTSNIGRSYLFRV